MTHLITDPNPAPTPLIAPPAPLSIPATPSTGPGTTPGAPSVTSGPLDLREVARQAAAAKAAAKAAKKAATLARTWMRLSAALGRQVPLIAGRKDVTVTLAPGMGRGAPGCFLPALGSIELDAATLTDTGINPSTCRPNRLADRERYAPLWGVFVHECAHARHSAWNVPTGDPSATPPVPAPGGAVVSAAMLLEETRIEAAHLARRPADRRWLRASATTLIMPEFATLTATALTTTALTTPAPSPAASGGTPAPTAPSGPSGAVTEELSVWSAAQAAGLMLARVDAGVLDATETASLRTVITKVLGAGRLYQLERLWREAQAAADDDASTMMNLARTWCATLGIRSDRPDPANLAAPDPTGTTSAPMSAPSGASPSGAPGPLKELLDAVTSTLTAVRTGDDPTRDPVAEARATARAEEKAARQNGDRAARMVFSGSHSDTGKTTLAGTRRPSETEASAARRLARALRAAGSRERVSTTTRSATPPGRLSMRGALAADAQRAAGASVTAEPFTRTSSRHVPTPPLRVAIACDVSGSMKSAAPAVASTAWIVNRAVAHVPDAKAATVIYGNHVRPITRPGKVPAEVTEFDADDGTERFTTAIEALDATLELTRRDAARLLVIVSDGHYKGSEASLGQKRIDRLRANGCAVLWVALAPGATPMRGARLVTVTDPATLAETITRAVAETLQNA